VADRRKCPATGLVGPQMQASVEAAALRIVAEMLAEDRLAVSVEQHSRLDDDEEFEDRLVRAELALIADAEPALQISLRVALVRAARDALRTCAEIRALPQSEYPGRPSAAPPTTNGEAMPSDSIEQSA
jgi:hypothetical protein